MSALLEVRDLVVEYRTGGYPVRPIDGLELSADAGEMVVLLGPSGCGKTTLLSVLAGILTPTSGSVRVGGADVTGLAGADLTAYRRAEVGIVFQSFNLVPSLSARENVAAPLLLAGVGRRAALRRADDLLDRVGLGGLGKRRPSRLSGGQQQRVAVARALVGDPPVLLADEPTANLDYVNAEAVIRLLRDLRSDGRLIVISTHDDRLVPIADRVIPLVQEVEHDAAPTRTIEIAAGEVLFRQGDHGDLVYVVEQGHIELTREQADGVEMLGVVGPRSYFGELGPTLGFPRSATARAVDDCVLFAMSVTEFRREVQAGTLQATSQTP